MEVKIKRSGKFNDKVYLDVVVNDLITIRGCKIVDGKNGGRFVAMPSQKGKDEKWYDHVRFETRELQDEFSHLVISAHEGNSGSNEATKEANKPKQAPDWSE